MAAGLLACVCVIAFAPLNGWWPTAVILAILLALCLHTTPRGEFVVWRELLDAQVWRGGARSAGACGGVPPWMPLVLVTAQKVVAAHARV
jgi:hypothetical protein